MRKFQDSFLAGFVRSICKILTKNSIGYKDADLMGFKIHDASTFMYLLYPELFTFKRGHTRVETIKESICYGNTLIDDRVDKDLKLSNGWVAVDVDADKAIFLFLRKLFDVLTIIEEH